MTVSSTPPPSRIRVLVVDDSKLTRISLKTTLLQSDCVEWVGEAEHGRDGVSLVGKLHPNVVLMDIGMPILDGVQATQQIKRQYPDVHVVMLTSHEMDRDVLDAFQSGATSYCLKDTAPEQLIQIIQSTNNGACWIDPRIARVLVTRATLPDNDAKQPTSDTGSSNNSLLAPLSERERDVLKLIATGKNNTEIAEALSISLNTVKTHVKNIFQKLDVEDRTAAALKAIKERLV